MDVTSQSREAYRDEIRKERLIELRRLLERFTSLIGDEALPALALAPYFPTELAVSLPIDDAKGTLLNAAATRMIESVRGPDPWTEPAYRMLIPVRDSVLQDLKGRRATTYLAESLSRCAKKMLELGGPVLEQEPVLWRWTLLAAAAESGARFDEAMAGQMKKVLAQSQDNGRLFSPEAMAWIEAAEPFAKVLGGAYEAAVSSAKRQSDLFHRHAHDLARLKNYCPRLPLDQTFLDLLADKALWALHFIGPGGTGKSMLIRHLALEIPNLPVAVSRVDFDYLNPDYPERDPGLLLSALADEFQLQAGADSERAFGSYESIRQNIYHRLESSARAGEPIRLSLSDPDFLLAIESFAEGLAGLLDKRRPVLILDTCEELAKIQPGGQLPRNVADTFEILKLLHDAYERVGDPEGLRVIFCGRRPLPAQTYLRVFQVEGFTQEEADNFFTVFGKKDGWVVKPELIPGIQRLSVASESPLRYNPYDLDTYASWAAVDSRLTEEVLKTSGPQPYIRERIIERLKPVVRRLLPGLAILGRFDRELVGLLIGASENLANETAEVLAQEWVQADTAGAVEQFRLDNLFRDRLLRFYQTEERAARQAAGERLAAILPGLIRDRKFGELTPQLFAACLEVLRDYPVRAAAWWAEVEARIASEAAWPWASELMKFLEPSLAGPMMAALLATTASVMLHTGGGDTSPLWKGVQAAVERHPTAEGRERLRRRAEWALDSPQGWEPLPPDSSPQAVAAFMGMAEKAIEFAERGPNTLPGAFTFVFDVPADVEAFGYLLSARLALLHSVRKGTDGLFIRAFEICHSITTETRQIWLDWIRPANLEHRVLLEFARLMPEAFMDFAERPELEESLFGSPLQSIDSDRFAAACLRLTEGRLAFTDNGNRQQFLALYESSLALAAEMPRCLAHQAYPPFFTVLLEARALSGEVEEVLEEIRKVRRPSLPDDVVLALDIVMARVIRAMRLLSEGLQIPETVLKSTRPEAVRLATITLALQKAPTGGSANVKSENLLEEVELAFVQGLTSTPDKALEADLRAEERRDPLGRLEARMLMALWAANHEDTGTAEREARSVRGFYEQLTSGKPKTPSWEQVEKAATSASLDEFLNGMGPRPAVWRPWVLRLVACLSTTGARAAGAWLAGNSSSTESLSPELRFASELSTPSAKPKPRIPPWIAGTGYFVIGLTAICGGTWFLYYCYTRLLAAVHISIALPWRLVSFVAVLALLGYGGTAMPKLVVYLLDLYWRLIGLQGRVEYPQTPPDLNRPLTVPGTYRSHTVCLFPFTASNDHETQLSATSEDGYQKIYSHFPWRARRFSYPLLARTLRLMVERELSVDSNTAAAPWEAILPFPELYFTRRRTNSSLEGRVPPEWTAPVEVLTWGGNALYSTRQDWGSNFHATFAAGAAEFTRSQPKTGVLRILGNPIDSTTGLLLQVGLRDGQSYSVRAADIPPLYPYLRLAILQCPPAELKARLSSDRRNAAILKRIGADLYSAGVPAVLLIPVLPARAAEELINRIYEVLGQQPQNAIPMLARAIRNFQMKWRKHIFPEPEGALEIVYDICLYAGSLLSFKIKS